MKRIYLDHAATTPVHPRVKEAMFPYLDRDFGNASSTHAFGREARAALDRARATIAAMLGVRPGEIVFTSGGTEADNLALIGVALANKERGRHIITTEVEHEAVLASCRYLEQIGFSVTYLPVDGHGQVACQQVAEALREDTILVSIIFGSNEVGTLQPLREVGELLRDRDAYLHTDAVQAFGVVPIAPEKLGIELLSASAHKINGPKGVGCLYVREGVRFQPLVLGGFQERERRAGTENVPGIVGFAEAAELATEERDRRKERYQLFHRRMLEIFEESGIEFSVNGHPKQSLPQILNVSFPGARSDVVLTNLDLAGIAASSGSACSAGTLEPSHVVEAMGGAERARSAIRFSFGLGNTVEQVEKAARETAKIVKRTANQAGDGR